METIRTEEDQNFRRQRLALIASIRAQGASLLSAATDDTMKTRIRMAMLDLDEAARWLNEDDVDPKPNLLQVVDTTIDLATRNMAIVAKALDDLKFDGAP